MSFIESRPLDCLSLGFQGGPTFSTQVVTLRSGAERRNALRAHPRYRFSAPLTNRGLDEHAVIIALYIACQGAAHGFRFKDPADYTATLASLGTTPGANQTPVQLIKTYTTGALSTVRTIRKPVTGTVTVYSNGVAKAGTYSTTTGLFTPTTNWTAGQTLTWSGQFDVPVRFLSDELVFDWTNKEILSATVDLIEDTDQ